MFLNMTEGVRKRGDTVGDYRLVKAISEGQVTRTWEAEQISMQRPVMLEMLKVEAAKDPAWVEAFLADVRAKALVTHSNIGSVYEAVSNESGTYFARERLEGDNLEEWYEQERQLTPLELMKLLQQLSAAMLFFERNDIATVEFGLHHIVVENGTHLRTMNLAVDGERLEETNTRAKQLLGAVFDDMIKPGEPGATRAHSLCGYMADMEREIPLTWSQISKLSTEVREQLEGVEVIEPPVAPEIDVADKPRKKVPATVWALLGGLLLIAAVAGVLMAMGIGKKDPLDPNAGDDELLPFVEIPTGEYDLPDGTKLPITQAYKISRTEVSLTEYQKFLEVEDPTPFQHPDQPNSKKSHEPDDWKALWVAAVKGEVWQGRAMAMRCPVVGIDWWDAYAYSQWSRNRLPTLAEWTAAAFYQGASDKIASWGPVDLPSEDLTGAQLLATAGSVREWTARLEANPADRLSPKKPVAAGGVFSDPGSGPSTLLWLESRNVRRPDLGFRVVLRR